MFNFLFFMTGLVVGICIGVAGLLWIMQGISELMPKEFLKLFNLGFLECGCYYSKEFKWVINEKCHTHNIRGPFGDCECWHNGYGWVVSADCEIHDSIKEQIDEMV